MPLAVPPHSMSRFYLKLRGTPGPGNFMVGYRARPTDECSVPLPVAEAGELCIGYASASARHSVVELEESDGHCQWAPSLAGCRLAGRAQPRRLSRLGSLALPVADVDYVALPVARRGPAAARAGAGGGDGFARRLGPGVRRTRSKFNLKLPVRAGPAPGWAPPVANFTRKAGVSAPCACQ